jgi:hypothetical protein
VPGATHDPHQPTKEWIDKVSKMHLFDEAGRSCAKKSLQTRSGSA